MNEILIALGSISPFLFFIFYLLANPEKAEKWSALLYKFIAWINVNLQKKYISNDIQGNINSFSKSLNIKGGGIIPYPLKLQWVSLMDKATFLENGEVIVRMNLHTNQDRNRVIAAIEYVSKALLPNSKIYIDDDLVTALDLMISKQILSYHRDNSAMTYFFDNYVKPICTKSSKTKMFFMQLEKIEIDPGLFIHILLREFLLLHEFYPQYPDNNIKNSTRKFTKFIYDIATRERWDDTTKLNFELNPISTKITLIASIEKKILGPERYIQQVETGLKKGYRGIYLLAGGKDNIDLAKRTANSFEGDTRIIKMKKSIYEKNGLKTLCIFILTKKLLRF